MNLAAFYQHLDALDARPLIMRGGNADALALLELVAGNRLEPHVLLSLLWCLFTDEDRLDRRGRALLEEHRALILDLLGQRAAAFAAASLKPPVSPGGEVLCEWCGNLASREAVGCSLCQPCERAYGAVFRAAADSDPVTWSEPHPWVMADGAPCLGCALATYTVGKRFHMYLVRPEIWAEANDGQFRGYLCLRCLQRRIGRPLTGDDFPPVPANRRVRLLFACGFKAHVDHLQLSERP